MSVPKTERKQSKFEVIYNADKLRKYMIFFLLKDLGVKNKVRDIEIIKKRVKMILGKCPYCEDGEIEVRKKEVRRKKVELYI